MRTDGKAAQNKRIKKDALMSTAFDLFSSNGVNHTTISDITERAGLGKGTFYSYFKDKYDIRNHIIAHKSAQIFLKAKQAIEAQPEIRSMEDKIIGMSDNIIDQLTRDKPTLSFIYKNLSWGVFRNVLTSENDTVDFATVFNDAIEESSVKYKDPLVMIYLIIELVSSTCYSSILYSEPMPIAELKTYLYPSIRAIMREQEVKEKPDQSRLLKKCGY